MDGWMLMLNSSCSICNSKPLVKWFEPLFLFLSCDNPMSLPAHNKEGNWWRISVR